MASNYDELYATTPDALGAPNTTVLALVEALGARPLRILDVGCGQGRDALELGRRGHHVRGVDISPNGIAQLNAAAREAGLDVEGRCADLRIYQPVGTYDLILMDRTLHMLSPGDRVQVLTRLLSQINADGRALIVDEPRNLPAFIDCAKANSIDWEIESPERGIVLFHAHGKAA